MTMRECHRVWLQPSKLALAGSSPVSRSNALDAEVVEAAVRKIALTRFESGPVLQSHADIAQWQCICLVSRRSPVQSRLSAPIPHATTSV